jgi:hypothetical protein
VLRSTSQSVPQPSLCVPRATAVVHAADIYFQYSYSQPLSAPVELHSWSSLSLHGPSGTSLVAICNLPCRAVSSVARLQTGDLALQRNPWRPQIAPRPGDTYPRRRGASGTGIDGDDDEFSDADDSSSDSSVSEAETTQQCPSDSDSSSERRATGSDSDGDTAQRCLDASDTTDSVLDK